MQREEFLKLADKIKSGQVTDQEKLTFFKELNRLLENLKSDISELHPGK